MYAKTRDGIRQKPKIESRVSLIESNVIHFDFYSVLRKKIYPQIFPEACQQFSNFTKT